MITFQSSISRCSLFVALIVAHYASASDRELQTIQVEGATYSMNQYPLETLWANQNSRPNFREIDSAKGDYIATWKIVDDSLQMADFSANSKSTGNPIALKEILSEPLLERASWYTGAISLAHGRLGSGAFGKLRTDKLLVIENGYLIKTIDEPKCKFDIQGSVGISINANSTDFLIDSIKSGTPAGSAKNLNIGDKLLGIESSEWGRRSTADMNLDSVVSRIQGPVGTTVRLFLLRKDGSETMVSLTRSR